MQAMAAGGRVVGVLPDVKLIHERRHPSIAEYIYTSNMSERKQKMMELSDAFIALPGGLGTLDELSDVLCLNRLGVFRKPIALVNTHGSTSPFASFCSRHRLRLSRQARSGFAAHHRRSFGDRGVSERGASIRHRRAGRDLRRLRMSAHQAAPGRGSLRRDAKAGACPNGALPGRDARETKKHFARRAASFWPCGGQNL